ncbi:anthranilate synthase family protein [Streptomyces sp. NBC_00536]|uniref:anthranilate synthase family protein n=1 Tax=Streptomyces sp. NBC_00536 TaxID=2975769 RepID=UPI002E81118E|nr:anthranilate synthase family protein [Streptomyces sp. NBC_00536]WUC80869.1 anthranilate synthase family protein [Streptomyces sp. NBC_00536]
MNRDLLARDLLARILAGDVTDFALLHRPELAPGHVEVLAGAVHTPAALADVPLDADQVLVVVPYRQLAERGFAAPDDGAPLLAMTVTERETVPLAALPDRIADQPVRLTGGGFDVDDEQYAATVRRIVTDEIGTGAGSNFVIKRTYTAAIDDHTPRRTAPALFRRLLEREQGAYWTFAIHTGGRTLVGATPERHVSLTGGTAVMNPISGTYRYPPTGPTLDGVTRFLADRKEADELYMVVDEELKMMARICASGGRVTGPHLKEMARLAHTEYFIEGTTDRDVREILHETMFAPTVTGSPLESAARVIRRHEPEGRGYYGGIAALIGRDPAGARTLDSAILIRTADVAADGRMRIGVGATLVRHSDPESEVAETRAKAAGLLSALECDTAVRFAAHPEVRAALAARNTGIASFWLRGCAERGDRGAWEPRLAGLRALVVDAEDTFTAMIGQQLASLGLEVSVRRFDEPYDASAHDLVVLGPGPGDPRDAADPRIVHLNALAGELLDRGRPFIAVCLSHQVLSLRLGLDLVRRATPNQGVQREIDLFGTAERVGFYNTYAAQSTEDKIDAGDLGIVEVSRDPHTREVHALRGAHFASMQFHAESVLTVDGPRILGQALLRALGSLEVAAR